MSRFTIIVEWDQHEQVWVSYVPALDHLSTYGDTKAEVVERTREAIAGYLEALHKEGQLLPTGDSQFELMEVDVATP